MGLLYCELSKAKNTSICAQLCMFTVEQEQHSVLAATFLHVVDSTPDLWSMGNN
jgi:hypothetical protein